jgi:hypothetical protein
MWVNVTENEGLDVEQFLTTLDERRGRLIDGLIDRPFVEAIDDLTEHIDSGYEGNVILATVDMVFQTVHEQYALRLDQSLLEFPTEYVHYDNDERRVYITKFDEDRVINNTFETNFRNVDAELGTWPVTIVPMSEVDDIRDRAPHVAVLLTAPDPTPPSPVVASTGSPLVQD